MEWQCEVVVIVLSVPVTDVTVVELHNLHHSAAWNIVQFVSQCAQTLNSKTVLCKLKKPWQLQSILITGCIRLWCAMPLLHLGVITLTARFLA